MLKRPAGHAIQAACKAVSAPLSPYVPMPHVATNVQEVLLTPPSPPAAKRPGSHRAHDVLPGALLNRPGGHTTHSLSETDPAALLPLVPGGHTSPSQALAPLVLKRPGTHASHDHSSVCDMVPAPPRARPARHATHTAAAAGDAEAARNSACLPCGQWITSGVHALCALAEICPIAHAVHRVAPTPAWKVFRGQSKHTASCSAVAPVRPYRPGWHMDPRQLAEAVSFEKRPASHGRQLLCPGSG